MASPFWTDSAPPHSLVMASCSAVHLLRRPASPSLNAPACSSGIRTVSFRSMARASAAVWGTRAAGPSTPTRWPLRRRISSQSPTLVPRRVIIAGGYVVRMCEVGGGADVQVLGGGTPGACWVVPSSYLIV